MKLSNVNQLGRKLQVLCCLAASTLPIISATPTQAADVSSSYTWAPVRLGAGGYVTGFVTHPLNANIRYCRTDVGNAYRWNGSEWIPMLVRHTSSGFPTNVATAPASQGVDSIAVDPNNANTVYLTTRFHHSSDVKATFPDVAGNVYKSTDGGVNFTAGGLSVSMEPNGPWRSFGERLLVDPSNSNVVYYGSLSNGLYRSTNGGSSWSQVTGGLSTSANFLGVQFASTQGTASLNGLTVSKTVYAVVGDGSVFRSLDGGSSWGNISAGTGLDNHGGFSTIDKNGVLYVVQKGSATIWRYQNGSWTAQYPDFAWGQNVQAVTVDPANTNRIIVIGTGGALSRSLNAGTSWTPLGHDLYFANTFSWLPQPIGWRANGGIYFDRNSKLWIPQGNEGVLGYTPNDTESASNPPKWTIDSKGIEEFVTHDVILPKGGKPVVAVEDSTALYVNDPAQLSAKQATLQDQLISNGTGLAYCPNAANYVVVATADVNWTGSGKNYSGYSADGGQTWTRFGSYPVLPETNEPVRQAGSIAVSRRNGWTQGSDHLVWLPSANYPPFYSKDGGLTWTRSSGISLWTQAEINAGQTQQWNLGKPKEAFYWNFSLKQRQLKADPFVADKYYLRSIDSLYISTDGGVNWQKQNNTGLPLWTHHGQLEVNFNVQNDLWFVDGWEGASEHGLWHSTNGGTSFTKISGVEYAITLTLGAGRGQSGDAPYTVYFYGKMSGDNNWGVFRSTNGGSSWDRISGYPTGITDQPTCMAASWDTFSVVYIGFNGNSYVYGKTNVSTQGPNLASNPGFEAEQYNTQTPSGWSEWSGNNYSAGYTENYGGSNSGNYHGTHWASSAYNMYTYQTKTGLTNGLYTLRVRAKNGGGQKSCYIEAKDYGSGVSKSIPVSSNAYVLVEIKDINVTNGKCTFGVWSDANAGNWLYFDDVEFFKQ